MFALKIETALAVRNLEAKVCSRGGTEDAAMLTSKHSQMPCLRERRTGDCLRAGYQERRTLPTPIWVEESLRYVESPIAVLRLRNKKSSTEKVQGQHRKESEWIREQEAEMLEKYRDFSQIDFGDKIRLIRVLRSWILTRNLACGLRIRSGLGLGEGSGPGLCGMTKRSPNRWVVLGFVLPTLVYVLGNVLLVEFSSESRIMSLGLIFGIAVRIAQPWEIGSFSLVNRRIVVKFGQRLHDSLFFNLTGGIEHQRLQQTTENQVWLLIDSKVLVWKWIRARPQLDFPVDDGSSDTLAVN
ncbi:hypothetical protein OSB04_019221 [Centaurea solstitialis]|uniref:Uncharacterized protein n=1 Tax=Centaurea solstitialis TaxID=347529 RepID=A0AA38SXI3_9ASTR|nr:hypothetical protein OSB04_019221 [Centaurea solstitialis]